MIAGVGNEKVYDMIMTANILMDVLTIPELTSTSFVTDEKGILPV